MNYNQSSGGLGVVVAGFIGRVIGVFLKPAIYTYVAVNVARWMGVDL